MEDIAGKFVVYRNQLIPAEEFSDIPETDASVYEVIRVVDGVPLFFEDHYLRMSTSLHSVDKKMNISQSAIAAGIMILLKAEGSKFCNIKLTIKVDGREPEPMYYISRSSYPDKKTIDAGVSVGLLYAERQNPNAKILRKSYKQAVAASIREGNFFEVLLVNSDGQITEGSRSNVFFVKGSTIFTAPGKQVLLGVTRKYVIEACKRAGYQIGENVVPEKELKSMDGVFLSGTSLKVLPVSEVAKLRFDSSENVVIKEVSRVYDSMLEEYVDANGRKWQQTD